LVRPPGHLYPFKSHFLEIRGQRLHYLDEGPRGAPPVLMLHGNPTWSFYYRNLITALSGQFRCIVPDHLGCGLSDKPGDDQYDYRLKSRIEDIDSLVRHLEIAQPITLVVHDWGGMIGFAWAVENPDLIARTVVLNTSAFPLPEDKKMPAALSLVRNTASGLSWSGSSMHFPALPQELHSKSLFPGRSETLINYLMIPPKTALPH